MHNAKATQTRIQARDAGMRLLNRLTAGVAVSAVAGVGLLGFVSQATIPGKSSSASTAASSTSSTSSTSSSTSTSSSSSLGTSTGGVSSSSGSGVAVSGGS